MMTNDQVKAAIKTSLAATPKQNMNNLWHGTFPAATGVSYGQYWGVLFAMIRSGEIIAERFYDLKRFGQVVEVTGRTDSLDTYDPNLWQNCWHVFYPEMYKERNNIYVRLP